MKHGIVFLVFIQNYDKACEAGRRSECRQIFAFQQ